MPIVDREGRIIAILAGCPSDELWPELARQAAEALEEGQISKQRQDTVHR